MGLLDTIIVKQSSKKKSESHRNSIEKTAVSFIEKEKLLPIDMSYPSAVIALMNTYFNFTKIIILSYDYKNDVWAPDAFVGIDLTSSRRIRFPSQFFKTSFPHEYSFYNQEEQISNFKPFFSIREFSMLKSIALFHSFSSDSISALMILDTEISSQIIQIIPSIIAKIDTVLIHNIKSEENPFTLSLFVSQYLSKMKNKKVYLFKLQFKSMAVFIQETLTEFVDQKQLLQDIFETIYSMINFSGILLQIDSYSSLLLFSSNSIHDPKILIKQITSAIKGYYSIQTELPPVAEMYLTYPDDGQESRILLKKLHIL